MIIYQNFDHIYGQFAACIGFFDGVHRGHQFLLQHLKAEADNHKMESAVITFSNHPRQLIEPDYHMEMIDSLGQRLDKLAKMDIDACFLMSFTEAVRQMSARQFIQEVLSAQMHVKVLIIGYDHRFGYGRSEGFDDYVRYGRECGMEVVREPVFDDGSGLNYSSSEIRRALRAGDKKLAAQLLGQPVD